MEFKINFTDFKNQIENSLSYKQFIIKSFNASWKIIVVVSVISSIVGIFSENVRAYFISILYYLIPLLILIPILVFIFYYISNLISCLRISKKFVSQVSNGSNNSFVVDEFITINPGRKEFEKFLLDNFPNAKAIKIMASSTHSLIVSFEALCETYQGKDLKVLIKKTGTENAKRLTVLEETMDRWQLLPGNNKVETKFYNQNLIRAIIFDNEIALLTLYIWKGNPKRLWGHDQSTIVIKKDGSKIEKLIFDWLVNRFDEYWEGEPQLYS